LEAGITRLENRSYSVKRLHFRAPLVGDFRPPAPFAALAGDVSLTTPLFIFVAAADWTRAGNEPFPASFPALACVDWIREAADAVVGFFAVGVFLLLDIMVVDSVYQRGSGRTAFT